MIFRTKYDLTLNEVSLMFETNSIRALCRYRWIPTFAAIPYFKKFMAEFSELFNKEETDTLYADDLYRLRIINRATNLIPAIYYGLVMTGDERFKELYKQLYGKDYKGPESLKEMVTEINRLGGKLKEIGTPTRRTQDAASLSFEQVITYVEMVLERAIDREMKLYQFKYQYDLAVKRAKEFEKMKLKNG